MDSDMNIREAWKTAAKKLAGDFTVWLEALQLPHPQDP
jgi:hypothetical protein